MLIVDDLEATVQTISAVLALDGGFAVVGSASDGKAGIARVEELRPDVVLMDINMPVLDGIAATEVIVARFPETAVVMLSAETDNDHLRRSMNVGASYFLSKPVSSDELYNAVRRAAEVVRLRRARYAPVPTADENVTPLPDRSAVIAFFSQSGGVGRTTLATNLAIALRRSSGRATVIADLSLPFGDVGVLLNAPPDHRSLGDLVGKLAEIDADDLESILFKHRSGVKALLAPLAPEIEERIGPEDVRKLLGLLRQRYEYVVVDTWPSYGESMLAVLEAADTVVLPFTPELTSVKNARVFLELMARLRLDAKVMLLANRADQRGGVKLTDVESSLGRKVSATVSSDEQALRIAMNRGMPIVDSHPNGKLTKELTAMARVLAGPAAVARAS